MNEPDKRTKEDLDGPVPMGEVMHKYTRCPECWTGQTLRCRADGHHISDADDAAIYRAYQWAKVTCPECLASRGKPAVYVCDVPEEEEKLCTVTEVVADLIRGQFPVLAEMLDNGGVMGLDTVLAGSVASIEELVMRYLDTMLCDVELLPEEFVGFHATHLAMLYLGVWLGQIGAAHLRAEPGDPHGKI